MNILTDTAYSFYRVMSQRRQHINYSPGNFDIVIFVCVCHGSEGCVSMEYHFVTTGSDVQGYNFKYSALSKERLIGQSKIFPNNFVS